MKTGVEVIAEERARQVSAEGFDAEHDDGHVGGELAAAGACYALLGCPFLGGLGWRFVRALWPWDAEWWKPNGEDAVRDLAKAGALIAAEIDRVQRRQKDVGRDLLTLRRQDAKKDI